MMMDDLISRKEALERLELLKKFNPQESIQIAIDVAEQQINFCRTAFDKEKVIEELKGEIELCVTHPLFPGKYIKKNRAIEIIEKGGIE